MQCSVLTLIISLSFVNSEFYDTYSGGEINGTRYQQLTRLGLVPYCAIEVAPCDPHEPRRMDGSCNNVKYPQRGAPLTPYRRLLPPVFSAGGELPRARSGKALPAARDLRVALMSDGRVSSARYTHMVVNYNVFLTGDITSLHDTVNYIALTRTCCEPGGEQDPRCIPIEVKDNDLHLRRSNVRCLNLTRAITYQRIGCVSDDEQRERINTAAPLLDLSIVYGHDGVRARAGRELRGGRLRSELLGGKEWPPSGGLVCLNNEPPRETRCHDTPTPGANSILGLNLLFIWLYRSHNHISRTLEKLNPFWNDDHLYFTAKEINIAFYNQILYYELMPELLGWDFLESSKVVFPGGGHVDDYDPTLEPRTSIEYIIGSRWFHTLQEGRLKLYNKQGVQYEELAAVDMILRTGALPLNDTIAGLTRGATLQPGGEVDSVVDPDVGERIVGRLQFASDVLASDLMKGRDVGLPPYNHYRKLCGLPVATSFKDLLGWMERPQVEAMASFYEHPDDIDLYAALLAERPMPRSGAMPDEGAVPFVAVGPTLGCIMAEQLLYWRRSDRFWYEHPEHPGAFTEDQLLEIRKISMAKLLCLHGDGVDSVQPRAFLNYSPRNKITSCSEYEMPNLNVFADQRCYPRPTSPHDLSSLLNQNLQGNQGIKQNVLQFEYPNMHQSSVNRDETTKHLKINTRYPGSIFSSNPFRQGYQTKPPTQTYSVNPNVAVYHNTNPDSVKVDPGYSAVNPFLGFRNYK